MSPITSPPSSPPTLLTIPPELLLQILTHLPTSSSLHALSLTSHTLSTFLHTHAATITNSLISTHHSHSSHLLHAQHTSTSSGFLVPTHSLILNEERRIQRDKILSSGCRCPPCRLMLHAGTSSTSDLSINSGSESDGLVSCLPALSMSTTARGKECKAREALKRTVKLTEPGPQFLVFLERYGWEVEARWDVYVKQLLAKVKEEDEDEEEEEGIQVMVEEKDANLKAFEFMVGNYCVRRFLEDAGRELTSFSELSQSKMTQPRTFKERMRKMFKKSCEKEVKEKKKVETSSRPSPPRMFGEIEKSPTTAVVEKDTWVKGLLWYHGFKSGTTTSLAIDDPVIGSTKAQNTSSKAKGRNCIAGMKAGMRKIGSRMMGMFGYLHCAGQFQELD